MALCSSLSNICSLCEVLRIDVDSRFSQSSVKQGTMNAEDYLARINHTGSVKENNVATLRKLCECHSRHVPFENLDMFGGKRKVLDLEKVYEDIVVRKRGGYCYENNGLFRWLLTQLGFPVVIIQAQGYWKEKATYNPEFDHMALQVTCSDGSEWLVDMGWGGSSFKSPLKIVSMEEQSQSNGLYRLNKLDDGGFVVEKRVKTVVRTTGDGTKSGTTISDDINPDKGWYNIYKFDLVPRKWSDFNEMCNYQQDNNDCFLKNNSVCCVQTEDGDIALWGWSIRRKRYISPILEEIAEMKVAKDLTELTKILKSNFDFTLEFDLQVSDRDFSGF